jgi:hypothetical protein
MMKQKKETGKKPEAKKDFIDFIKDASKDQSRVNEFLVKLSREDTNKEALCQLLHDWGYSGVSVKDCAKVLQAVGAGSSNFWVQEIRQDY